MTTVLVALLALLLAVPAFAQVPPTGPLGLPLGPAVPGIIQPPTLTGTTSSVTSSPDVTVPGTFTAPGDSVVVALSGRQGVGFSMGGAVTATATATLSFDGGVTYTASPLIVVAANSTLITTSVSSGAGTSASGEFVIFAGATHVRLVCTALGAGTVAVTLNATQTPGFVLPTSNGQLGLTGSEQSVLVRPLPAGALTTTFGASTFGFPPVSSLRLGGTPFTLRTTSAAFTPVAVSATLPPHPVMTFSGHAVAATSNYVIDAVSIRVLGAASTAYTVGARLVRRHVLYASSQTATPAAGAVPTCAALAYTSAPNGGGSYLYKYAAVDIWGNEGNLSGASAACAPAANNGETVTMPAVPAGAAGYNVYRTVTGPGATYFFLGRTNTTTFRDITADSSLTLAQGSISAWGTLPAIETLTQPVELVMEKFIALTGTAPVIVSTKTAPATKDNNRVVTIAPGTAVGRYRIPGEVEAKAFLAAPTITTALARDIDTDYGMGGTTQINAAFGDIAVNSFNQSDAGMGGTFVVWGHDLIGMTEQQSILSNNAGVNQLAGIAEGTTLTMKWVAPPVFATADEVAIEVGAFGTAASVTLEVYVSGRVF